MSGRGDGDKKLTAVGIRSGISHCSNRRFRKCKRAVKFIFKFVTRPTSSVTFRIATLDHKVSDNSVENKPFVETFFGKKNKITNRLGILITKKSCGEVS